MAANIPEWKQYTFADGPSHVPREVLASMKKEFQDWNGMGICMLEMGFRNPAYVKHFNEVGQMIRQIYSIPQEFQIYYMTCGDEGHFAALPMNLLKHKTVANYLNTGYHSQRAIDEASIFCKVNQVARLKRNEKGLLCIPQQSEWKFDKEGAYLHYIDADFTSGVALNFTPKRPEGQLLTACYSSSFLSKQIDWSQLDVVYAEASTFGGCTGVEFCVIRDKLIDGHKHPKTPFMLDYEEVKKAAGMPNTPQNYPIYECSELFKLIIKNGGIATYQQAAEKKSKLLYNCIDQSKGFYWNEVAPEFRSQNTATWRLPSLYQETLFLEEAKKNGLIGLEGFKGVGGLRANLYLGVPEEAVKKLVDFMVDFKTKFE